MTISAFRSRSGDVPPGCIDGFCSICKREVIADERDPRCDNCGQQLHPASLPRVPDHARNGVQAGESEPDLTDVPVETVRPLAVRNGAAAADQPVKTRLLPPTRAARKWDAATDEWVAEAEAAEAAAKLKIDAARAEYKLAAETANYARQMRQLARVDGATLEPAAKPAATPKSQPADKPIRTHHIGRHAASGICKGCPPIQEAQTHGDQ